MDTLDRYVILYENDGYWGIYEPTVISINKLDFIEIIKNYENDLNNFNDGKFKTRKDAEKFITDYIEPYLVMRELIERSNYEN